MKAARTALSYLNSFDEARFVATFGPFFEHSPWIAQRAWKCSPFRSRDELLATMLDVLNHASTDEKLSLIRAHPDLVGRLAREGRLTHESTGEQAAAGLNALTAEEVAQFDAFNARYRARFDFPFIICARENKKNAILAAFPVRLENTREQEIAAALVEIGKIARLRLLDAVSE